MTLTFGIAMWARRAPASRAAGGGYRGNATDVDYDLGYDAEGWDTQGFRRPETDYLDSYQPGHAGGTGVGAGSDAAIGTAVRPDHGRAPRGRSGSHARTAGAVGTKGIGTEGIALRGSALRRPPSWGGNPRPPGPYGLPRPPVAAAMARAGPGGREARGASADRGAVG